MTTEQQMVKEFMQTFGQETPDNVCIPSLEVRKLRAKLILEEALETIEALGFTVNNVESLQQCIKDGLYHHRFSLNETVDNKHYPNLFAIADGLADLDYVSKGTALACGLDMKPIFKEVHRSNMSKLWTRKEYYTLSNFEYKGCSVVNITSMNPDEMLDGDRPYLVKDKDGKVVKSPSYSPANIEEEIFKQQSSK